MYFTILEGVDIKVLQIEEIKFELQDYKNKLEEMRVSL
jgi:thiamine pyrophosphokinase